MDQVPDKPGSFIRVGESLRTTALGPYFTKFNFQSQASGNHGLGQLQSGSQIQFILHIGAINGKRGEPCFQFGSHELCHFLFLVHIFHCNVVAMDSEGYRGISQSIIFRHNKLGEAHRVKLGVGQLRLGNLIHYRGLSGHRGTDHTLYG